MAIPKLEAQAGKLNLTIEQGATFNPVLTYTDDQVPPVAIDLSGYDARMHIRAAKGDATTLDELSVGSGITLGGVAGTIALLITDTDTAAYTWTKAVYDLEIISAGGIVTRLLQGAVIVTPEVTI